MQNQLKYLLLTGASTGIGLVTAGVLAKNRYYVFAGRAISIRSAYTINLNFIIPDGNFIFYFIKDPIYHFKKHGPRVMDETNPLTSQLKILYA
ncbi:hypothetical protein LB465_12395 [Salegentibacter sp. LM13S]|uniref:hypothetical protein n=1 Tax=Salegentibacter lacus TaxID=2873599 RepID=UPI001CC9D2F9|nr:hypothetical protein [Salegentibacter lacus]MBZ9631582.1 hypothetical protein [Salegentibacter lacus]